MEEPNPSEEKERGPEHRLAYGACCTWWGYIEEVGKHSSGLPCCPHCKRPLFETTKGTWEKNVQQYEAEIEGEKGYAEFVAWCHNRCFPNIGLARAAYHMEKCSPTQ